MIALNLTTMKLQAVMGSATNTTQPFAHVWFFDIANNIKTGMEDYKVEMKRTALNSTTAVDICDAPGTNGTKRIVVGLSIVNSSLDTEIITLQTTDGTTVGPVITQTLLTTQSLHWSPEADFYVMGP